MLTIARCLGQTYSNDLGVVRLEVWGIVLAALGLFLFVRGFQMLRYKRLVLNTPESKIRSAAMGLVEIEGIAKGPQTIPAGITGDPCFYYRAAAWRLVENGRSLQWKCVADERLFIPFYLEDSTGRVLVDANGAELDVHPNFKDEFGASVFGMKDAMPPTVRQFLMRYGLAYDDRIRVEEYCIKPDYPLFVLGTLGRNSATRAIRPSPAAHFPLAQASLKSRLNLFGPAVPLLRFLGTIPGVSMGASISAVPAILLDNPPTGGAFVAPDPRKPAPAASSWTAVSMDEDEMGKFTPAIGKRGESAPLLAASRMPIALADREAATPGLSPLPIEPDGPHSLETAPPVEIGKGLSGAPFTISHKSQKETVRALAWKSTLCIWGGPLLTVVCVYFLLEALGWR